MRHTVPLTFFFLLAIAAVVWANHAGATAQSGRAARLARCLFRFPTPAISERRNLKSCFYAFLDQGCYKNWIADRQIRNTGPFINNQAFGTHNSVRIYYSPEVWHWLKEKHREGEIPDGAAMIVKEMFPLRLNRTRNSAPGR